MSDDPRIEPVANQLRSQFNDFDSPDILMRKRARMILRVADQQEALSGDELVAAMEAEREQLARSIYSLSPYQTNAENGKLLGYFRDLTFEECGNQDSFYAIADGILAAGYRKVAPAVPFGPPAIEGPWYY